MAEEDEEAISVEEAREIVLEEIEMGFLANAKPCRPTKSILKQIQPFHSI